MTFPTAQTADLGRHRRSVIFTSRARKGVAVSDLGNSQPAQTKGKG